MKYLLSWMGLFDIVGYFKIKNILLFDNYGFLF